MASAFDPYYKWLGIPPEEQPPSYYRLLGLRVFESDPEVIESAADQRMTHLRNYQTGAYSALSQRLLNEVSTAKICLLSAERRAKYDETLRTRAGEMATAAPPPPGKSWPLPPPMPATATTAASIANRVPLGGFNGSLSPEAPPVAVAPAIAGSPVFDLERLGVTEEPGEPAAATAAAAAAVARPRAESPWRDSPASAAPAEAEARPNTKPKPKRNRWIAMLAGAAAMLGVVAGGAFMIKYFASPQPPAATADGQANADANDPPRGSADAVATTTAVAAPVPGSPASGTTLPNPNQPTEVKFSWQAVPRADRYWLQVESPRLAKRVVDADNLHDTSFSMKLGRAVPKSRCHGWRWRVRAMVDGQWSDWSESRTFAFTPPPVKQGKPLVAKAAPAAEKPKTPSENEKPEAKKPNVPKAVVKQPLPSEDARRKASEAMRELYASRYAAAKTANERRDLAGDMLRKADEPNTDPATRYALMDRARTIAANCGDLLPALAIADHMARHFDVHITELKRDTLNDSLDAASPAMLDDPSTGACVLDVMNRLERGERYDEALQLGNFYCVKVRPTGKSGMLRQVGGEIRAIRDAEAQSAKVADARKVLATKPDDAAASSAVGRYRCLFQGDWRGGLPLLVKGDDAALRDLARQEQAAWDNGLADQAALLKLADAWYARAEIETAHTLKLALYRRAGHWYEACLEGLSDDEKAKVRQRIEQIAKTAE